MLTSICIRKHVSLDETQPFDIGFLAECMLFYEKVSVVTDQQSLPFLIQRLGVSEFIELLSSGFLDVIYLDYAYGIQSSGGQSNDATHRLIQFRMEKMATDRVVIDAFTLTSGKSGLGRRMGRRALQFIRNYSVDNVVEDTASQDFHDQAYVDKSIDLLLRSFVPGFIFSVPIVFNVEPAGERNFRISTNIDFAEMNKFRRKSAGTDAPNISVAWLLSALMEVSADIYFAGELKSEIATDTSRSSVIKLRLDDLIRQSTEHDTAIQTFQDDVLDGHAIREVLNTRPERIPEFVHLLKHARKFRTFASDQAGQDKNLLTEYYRKATESTWISSLPSKSMRWMILTAIGFKDPGLAIGLSAADTFLVEKLFQGWRPNMFVEKQLRKLVR